MTGTRTRQGGCDIAVLVDEEVGERDGRGGFVADAGSMEAQVAQALHRSGHKICVVPFDPAVTPTIEALRALEPRLVFNLTEWIGGDRSLDAAIAGLLEMLKLPYTGASPAGMQLARDKALAKRIVAGLGIEVAPHRLLSGRRSAASGLRFPVIVKPQFGDGSEAIARNALARNPRELVARVAAWRKRSVEPLICEEFVEGTDLYVGLLGNEPRIMPPIELVIGRRGAGAPAFSTFNVKHDLRYQQRWQVAYQRAVLPAEVLGEVNEASRRIFRALKQRDYARIDFRLTPERKLVFLEVNPNPDLSRDTFGRCHGRRHRSFSQVSYPGLIEAIVSAALARG